MYTRLTVFLFTLSACEGSSASKPDSAGDSAGETADDPVWVDVEAAGHTTCALDSAGAIACWGWPAVADAAAPEGPFVALQVASDTACGLRLDGTIACWGAEEYDYDLHVAPEGVFTDLALGDELGCATDAAGALTCWGRLEAASAPERLDGVAFDITGYGFCEMDDAGAIGCSGTISTGTSDQQPPEGTYSEFDLGRGMGCAIGASDGRVSCFGTRGAVEEYEPLGRALHALSVGDAGSCAIDADGALSCEGTVPPYRDEITLTGPFVDVAAGSRHLCALRETGEIVCQGDDTYGQSDPPADR